MCGDNDASWVYYRWHQPFGDLLLILTIRWFANCTIIRAPGWVTRWPHDLHEWCRLSVDSRQRAGYARFVEFIGTTLLLSIAAILSRFLLDLCIPADSKATLSCGKCLGHMRWMPDDWYAAAAQVNRLLFFAGKTLASIGWNKHLVEVKSGGAG